MKIIVSGSVGTGKTTLAKKLAKKFNSKYLNIAEFVKKNKLGKYSKKYDSYEVDIKKLNNKLIEIIKKNKNIVIDGHLAHFLPKKYVDLCIVCKCDIKELKKRLKKRKYSDKKIHENMDVEIFDTILTEAKEKKYKTLIIDTTRL